MDQPIVIGRADTPHGAFGAVLSVDGLCCLTFPSDPFEAGEAWARRRMPKARVVHDESRLEELASQLQDYFSGRLRRFTIPLDMHGTPFQRQVWQAVYAIEYGEVRSYAQVAAAIGRPSAVRAVGAANGANPIPIIIPCHRVIGSDGKLVAYGGSLPMKRELLTLEGAPV